MIKISNLKAKKWKRRHGKEKRWKGEKEDFAYQGSDVHTAVLCHNEPVAGDEQSSSLHFTPRGKAFCQVFKANLFIQTVFLI